MLFRLARVRGPSLDPVPESPHVMTKSLFSRAAAALTLAATTVLVGCIKSDGKTTLNKDGSGVLTERLEMDMSQMKALMDLFGSFANPGGEPGMDAGAAMGEAPKVDMTSEFKKMEDRLRKTEGLTVKDFKTEEKDGKAVAAYTVEFKEWSQLGKGGAFPQGAELVKNADGSYTFTIDPASALSGAGGGGAAAGAGGPGAGAGGMDMAALAPILEPFLGSMEMAATLTVPGTIVETNGTKSEDGSTVSWKFGFKDITAGKGGGMQKVTFKGEGLELKPFKTLPDVDEMKDMFGGSKSKADKPAPDKPAGDKPAGDKPDGEKPADPK